MNGNKYYHVQKRLNREHRYKALMDLGVIDIPVYVGEQWGASGRLKKPYPGIAISVHIPDSFKQHMDQT